MVLKKEKNNMTREEIRDICCNDEELLKHTTREVIEVVVNNLFYARDAGCEPNREDPYQKYLEKDVFVYSEVLARFRDDYFEICYVENLPSVKKEQCWIPMYKYITSKKIKM